jgi:hypothetical protein
MDIRPGGLNTKINIVDPGFKTSFIPKKQTGSRGGAYSRSIDIIPFTVYTIFIIAVLASAGLFGYRFWLQRSIAKAKEQVVVAREAIDFNLLNELDILDRRLKAVRTIIDNHISSVRLFELLEDKTVSDLRYNSFDFESGIAGGAPKLILSGEARDLASIAAQSMVYKAEDGLEDTTFVEINQDQDENVTFRIESGLDPNLIKYNPNPL